MAAQPFEEENPKVKNDRIDHDSGRHLSRLPSPPTSDDRPANEERSPGRDRFILAAMDTSTLRERYNQHRGKVRSVSALLGLSSGC